MGRPGRKMNLAKKKAIENGDMYYEGKPCMKAGHTKRYIRPTSKRTDCVECKNEMNTKRKMEKYHSDPVYRLKDIRGRQLRKFIKRVGGTKTGRTKEVLGYTVEELKNHLESLFKEGMTWDNHGKWHIDHRIPQSYFTTIDQMRECFALDNLKPEWGEWNRSKGNRFIG